jgi:hypothetical protein
MVNLKDTLVKFTYAFSFQEKHSFLLNRNKTPNDNKTQVWVA